MTEQQSEIASRCWRPLAGVALSTAAIIAVGFTVAGCGGPSTPAAATRSATATTQGSEQQTGKPGPSLLAYSRCMRTHGVPSFPDPASSGGIDKSLVIAAISRAGSAQSTAAGNACRDLLPAGGSLSGRPVQTVGAQQQRYYVKAAACMRSHGVANFPDPSFAGGRVEFPRLSHTVDLNSPQVRRAYGICRKLIPAGLPYSSGSGE